MKLPDMTQPLFESPDMMMGFGNNADNENCVYIVMKADAGLDMLQMTRSLVPGFDNVLDGIQNAFGINELEI